MTRPRHFITGPRRRVPVNVASRSFSRTGVVPALATAAAQAFMNALTPECASIVATVLDALSAPAGAQDTRSQAQRYHDALHEAMRQL